MAEKKTQDGMGGATDKPVLLSEAMRRKPIAEVLETYDEEAVARLIDAALGVSRMLQTMGYEERCYPLAASYTMMHEILWQAVEGVAGDPMELEG